MVFDIHHNGFRTFDEFLDYAEGASNGPASVFVHLCCLQQKNGEYVGPDLVISDISRPCAIFSYLAHIVRDFRKDQLNNLNYFALDILEKYGLTPADLRRIAGTGEIPASFREVIREYKDLAEGYKIKTAEALKTLRGKLAPRYELSLEIIFHLYNQVYDRIDPDRGTFSAEELNPGPEDIRNSVLECLGRFKRESLPVMFTT
jgi:phytoene/squalene synthetase